MTTSAKLKNKNPKPTVLFQLLSSMKGLQAAVNSFSLLCSSLSLSLSLFLRIYVAGFGLVGFFFMDGFVISGMYIFFYWWICGFVISDFVSFVLYWWICPAISLLLECNFFHSSLWQFFLEFLLCNLLGCLMW